MEDKLYVFNYTQNRDKLFNNLISIIDGILSDGVVRDEEILYLDTWLLEAGGIIQNGVIKGLTSRVSKILSEGAVTEEDRQELKQQLLDIQRDILDIPEVDFFSIESDLHLLTGLCKGLISDKTLSEEEIRYLDWWLTQNGSLKNNYPGKELYSLVKDILKDGVITTEESQTLHKALIDFTGCDLESGVVDGLSTKLPVDNDVKIILEGKVFCLTGVFMSGKRSHVEDILKRSNSLISNTVTKKIDYLVIGTLSSRDWRFSSHGRKIEKAITYRDNEGVGLKVISEEMLFEILPRT